SSRYPVSAGASIYVHHGFGRKSISQIVGFLMILSALLSSATLARGGVGYFQEIAPVNTTLIIILLFLVLGAFVAWGITSTARLAGLFTLVELIGLGLIIWSGRNELIQPESYTGFLSLSLTSLTPILLGAFLAFYAYIGFEDMVNVAEEVKAPKKTMPKALLLSLIISTIMYLLVVVVATNALPIPELAASNAPLSLVFSRLANTNPLMITLIGIASAINGILVHIVLVSRVLYGMASRGWVHRSLGRVHSNTQTPLIATGLTISVMMITALSLPLISLAQLTSWTVLGVFSLVNGALVIIKLHKHQAHNAIAVPIWVPALGMLTCLGLIIYQLLA
ncbi:amino acid permease, partial [Candidatus Saccharibacteria bacterium]|nr:amino acid permease [Candidatus Saccharibacteria bacterium]